LNIETDRLTVQDGATIQTSTQGSGDAGNLRIRAHESVELVGTIGSSQSSTALLTLSGGIPNLPFSGNQERSGLSAIHEGMFKQAVAEAYFKAIGEADSGW
jgi:large exoprotein involved in heme utilization and adhesion